MSMKKLHACSGCGLIVKRSVLSEDLESRCPRCHTIIEYKGHDFSIIIALALAALFLYIPATTMPIMTAEVGGILEKQSLFTAIFRFADEGYFFVAFLLFLFLILMPVILIISILMILIPVYFNIFPPWLNVFSKLYHSLHYWMMFDVYILSMIVASVKLLDTTELLLGAGIGFFLILFVIMFFLTKWFNIYDVWRKFEQRDH